MTNKKLRVLMFGCSSNLFKMFDRKTSSRVYASLQPCDRPTALRACMEALQ